MLERTKEVPKFADVTYTLKNSMLIEDGDKWSEYDQFLECTQDTKTFCAIRKRFTKAQKCNFGDNFGDQVRNHL